MTDRNGQPEYFPGSTEPVPMLLTALEAGAVLRLDTVTDAAGRTRERDSADVLKSIDYLVRRKRLVARRFGQCRTFLRSDVFGLIRGGSE